MKIYYQKNPLNPLSEEQEALIKSPKKRINEIKVLAEQIHKASSIKEIIDYIIKAEKSEAVKAVAIVLRHRLKLANTIPPDSMLDFLGVLAHHYVCMAYFFKHKNTDFISPPIFLSAFNLPALEEFIFQLYWVLRKMGMPIKDGFISHYPVPTVETKMQLLETWYKEKQIILVKLNITPEQISHINEDFYCNFRTTLPIIFIGSKVYKTLPCVIRYEYD